MKIKELNKGFTVIELSIVVAILVILTGILLPAISRAREAGRKTQCASNLKQIGLGLIMYSNENNETLPNSTDAMTSLNLLYPDYVVERKIFKCPSDNLVTDSTNASITSGTAFTKNQSSYGYDRLHAPTNAPGVALAADRPSNTTANVPQNATTPTAGSPNHAGSVNAAGTADIAGAGQNVVYIDGHVEWVGSPTAGYAGTDSVRDNIYVDTAGVSGGTDTYILQDGV